MPNEPFSRRRGYRSDPPIEFVEELPKNLRSPILDIAVRHVASKPLLDIVTRVLDPYGTNPKKSGSSTVFFVRDRNLLEAREAVSICPWYSVYDITEALYRHLQRQDSRPGIPVEGAPHAPAFERQMNAYFVAAGIGWQLANGEIVRRGEEAFEAVVKTAQAEAETAGRPTAARRIREALQDLSRRPEPDYAGAVSHALSALEAIAKDVTAQGTLTLGQLIAQGKLSCHPLREYPSIGKVCVEVCQR